MTRLFLILLSMFLPLATPAAAQTDIQAELEWSRHAIEDREIGAALPDGVDVGTLGIRLGDTYKTVVAILQQEFPKAKFEENRKFYEIGQGVKSPAWVWVVKVLAETDTEIAKIDAIFGSPLTGHRLMSLQREITYKRATGYPLASEFLAQLKTKFGEPSYADGFIGFAHTSVSYVFNESRRVLGLKNNHLCALSGMTVSAYRLPVDDLYKMPCDARITVDFFFDPSSGGYQKAQSVPNDARYKNLKVVMADYARAWHDNKVALRYIADVRKSIEGRGGSGPRL